MLELLDCGADAGGDFRDGEAFLRTRVAVTERNGVF